MNDSPSPTPLPYRAVLSPVTYQAMPPPLRPCAADTARVAEVIARLLRPESAPRVLVLGATPDYARLPWPKAADLLAVDRSAEMLHSLWPLAAATTKCADWRVMPLPPDSRDLALCDGGLTYLSYPDDLRRFVHRLQEVLSPGGRFVTRVHLPPEAPESPADVVGDLLAGRIANSGILKLRLAKSVARGPDRGARLRDVWRAYRDALPAGVDLDASTGWSATERGAIDAYARCEDRYYFPSHDEIVSTFVEADPGFELDASWQPGYDYGAQVRILTLVRR